MWPIFFQHGMSEFLNWVSEVGLLRTFCTRWRLAYFFSSITLSTTLWFWIFKTKQFKWWPTLYNIINCWTLSDTMCLKSHWISETKNILTEEWTIGTFCAQVQFLFLFSHRRTLKFLEMKCNPTNKKLWPYTS